MAGAYEIVQLPGMPFPSWFSVSADDPHMTMTDNGLQPVMTRAQWDEWAADHMPNGRCICYPERRIVCGQHDPRWH